MPDFSWTADNALLRARSEVRRDFERLGYAFSESEAAPAAGDGSEGRPRRPRSVGVRADGAARVELIGPPEVVFKATLMARAPAEEAAAPFLGVMTPSWEGGVGWVGAHAAAAGQLGRVGAAATRYEDFRITLRGARGGKELVIGVTWEPRRVGS